MTATPQHIYERYVWAGAIDRNADALAEMFAVDGVLESPLVPADYGFPRRLEGRDEIRAGMAAYYDRSRDIAGTVNAEKSRYVLHTTADPDVFIVEIDTVFDGPETDMTVSLVKIFRIHDEKIVLLRDYFAPELVD